MGKERSAVSVILVILSPFFCLGLHAAEPTESKLAQQAAERDLPRFLKAAWEMKADFGFQPDDKSEEVKLAKPMRVYGIDEDIVRNMKDGSSLAEVLAPGNWIFPVEVNGAYRTIFLVGLRNGHWKGFSLAGEPAFAQTLRRLRQSWSDQGQDSFRLVSCDDPRSWFFIVTSVNVPNLTPLTSLAWVSPSEQKALAPPANLSSWLPAAKVISELKLFWSKGKHWGPFGGLEAEPKK